MTNSLNLTPRIHSKLRGHLISLPSQQQYFEDRFDHSCFPETAQKRVDQTVKSNGICPIYSVISSPVLTTTLAVVDQPETCLGSPREATKPGVDLTSGFDLDFVWPMASRGEQIAISQFKEKRERAVDCCYFPVS